MDLLKKLEPSGQKKILSLDGGGILGLMTVEILAKLEFDLRIIHDYHDLVLSDYFDFVCGTSTGAILAACISAGMSIDQLRTFYVDSGKDMFDKAFLLTRITKYKYNDEPLAKKIRTELNRALGYSDDDIIATLGDPNLKTVLMLMMRNHTTDSPWAVSNNPYAKYNQKDRKDCNLNLPLWQLVRASTAAPTFFPPEVVTFAEGTSDEYSFIFVDGGVTTYNNPAFFAFQMATAKPYGMNWKTGVNDLLIVSVGTGKAAKTHHDLDVDDMHLVHHAKNVPAALMNAASSGWDMACRMLGHCRFGAPIDREYGDMVIPEGGGMNWTGDKLFSYVRYDPNVTKEGLKELGLDHINPEDIQSLDSVEHIKDIQEVGRAYADKYLKPAHLGSFV
ncbi:patatin-like phospholipase family protein [Sulfurovum sp.]|uniref:patatin-like phospholipase family protein n=1 Tax=Sulfurovum sp. TaxID=1969726 RepID=UPI002600FCD4|nr:patatin-like phospholipase family protein [Sulfurovum sp.]